MSRPCPIPPAQAAPRAHGPRPQGLSTAPRATRAIRVNMPPRPCSKPTRARLALPEPTPPPWALSIASSACQAPIRQPKERRPRSHAFNAPLARTRPLACPCANIVLLGSTSETLRRLDWHLILGSAYGNLPAVFKVACRALHRELYVALVGFHITSSSSFSLILGSAW